MKAHIHCEVIIAYANGSIIECQNVNDPTKWIITDNPSFNVAYKYRVHVVDLVLESMKEKLAELLDNRFKLIEEIDSLEYEIENYVPEPIEHVEDKTDHMVKGLRRGSIRKSRHVHNLLSDNPTMKIEAACKLHKVSPATYYIYKRGLLNGYFPKSNCQ